MNIVAESKKHKTPKSLAECLKPDLVTNTLWSWAERLEKLGKILFYLVIVSGIIVTLTASITFVEVEYYSWTETETHFSFEAFLIGIFDTALYAFIEYCAYNVLALLISALANITQSTKVAARILEYTSLKQYPEEILEEPEVSQPAQTNVDGSKKSNGKCQLCGAENVEVINAVIIDDLGTRHRTVCESCFENNNCKPL